MMPSGSSRTTAACFYVRVLPVGSLTALRRLCVTLYIGTAYFYHLPW